MPMPAKQILRFLTVIALVCCKARNTEIDLPLSLLQERPDSALILLDRCDRSQLSLADLARYSLLYTWAQDKSGVDVTSDSLIRLAYDHYGQMPEDSLYARCLYYMGKYYLLNDSSKAAEDCLKRAAAAARKQRDYYTEYLALSRLGKSVLSTDASLSASYIRQALEACSNNGERNTINHGFLLLNLGEAYTLFPQPDSALIPISKALQIGREQNSSSLVRNALQDLAVFYSRKGDYAKALDYSKQAWNCSPYHPESLVLNLAYSYAMADSMEQANSLLASVAEQGDQKSKYIAYKNLFRNSVPQGPARAYADSAFENLERIAADIRETKSQYYRESRELYEHNLQQKSRAAVRTVLMSAALAVAVAIAIGLFIIYRLHRSFAQKKYEMQKQLSEQELEKKQLQIDTVRNYLISKLTFMVEFNNSQGEKFINLTEEHWQEIETFLDGTDNLFVKRLREKYPQLREKDIQFCMLVRLGISTRILSCICHINERSIKQKLLHFKEKLGINSSEISLRQFIQSL